MSTPKQAAMELYTAQLEQKFGVKAVNVELLNKIVNKLGIAAYNTTSDAAMVSGKDQTEKDVVINKLLIGNLGLESSKEELNSILDKVLEEYGMSNSRKYRVVIYYVIISNLKMVDAYMAL
jgi:hypothetical protein